MATVYFTTNADSGDGSLRAAISNATAGDTIEPQGFPPGDIEILLASALSWKSVYIKGSLTQRIIINGQSSVGFASGGVSNPTYEYIDFKDLKTTTNAPLYLNNMAGTCTFNNCRFYGCVGSSSGVMYVNGSSVTGSFVFNNCISWNNTSGTSTPALLRSSSSTSATFTFNGCTFVEETTVYNITGSTSTSNGSLISGVDDVSAATAGFVNAAAYDFRLTPTSPYLTGANITGTDYLGHARAGSFGAYDGSWFVVTAGGSAQVEANITVDYIDVGTSALVNLIGADRFITARKGIENNAATFATASGVKGYLATPNGATISSLILSGVTSCVYGAGVTAFSGAIIAEDTAEFTITKTNDLPVLLEGYSGGAWSTLTTSAATGTTAAIVSGVNKFRTFDGAAFKNVVITVTPGVTFWRIDNETTAESSGGDSANAWSVSAWAVDPEIEE